MLNFTFADILPKSMKIGAKGGGSLPATGDPAPVATIVALLCISLAVIAAARKAARS